MSSSSFHATPNIPTSANETPEDPGIVAYWRLLVDGQSRWAGQGSYFDLESKVKLNTSLDFTAADGLKKTCCMFLSNNNTYFAIAQSIHTNQKEITVEVFDTGDLAVGPIWTSKVAVQITRATEASEDRGNVSLNGFISNDGDSALVYFRVGWSDEKYYVTSNRGSTWTSKNFQPHYLHIVGIPSSDGQHLFFTRRGTKFNGARQAEIVEAYSVKTWRVSKSLTFGFGDGRKIHNISLIPFLSIYKPIWCSAKNTIFSSSGHQFQCEAESPRFAERFISKDNKHLVVLGENNGLLHYWDLTRPTYKPFASVELPGVEISQKHIHRIKGKDILVPHAIPKQVRSVRFSPGGQIATIIVANYYSVVIHSFLTYNLQLVHSKIFKYDIDLGIVPLQVFVGKERGVSLIGASPARGSMNQGFGGLICMSVKVPGAFEEICAIENYFDPASFMVKMDRRIASDGMDKLLHQWTITDTSLIRKRGVPLTLSAEEQEYQNEFTAHVFQLAYANEDIKQQIVPLIVMSYPWDPRSKVITFLVRLKYDFCIISMAISPASLSKPYLLRVLYQSDMLFNKEETIEIYQKGVHYILHVDAESNCQGGYSGMPLPSRRSTIIGHHFLPEDAHYDLILVKNSTACTMPSGYNIYPNTVLAFTASFAAYFPDGYMQEGALLDYGYRLRSEYTMARILMWLDYPQRSRAAEPFIGGGQLTDELSKAYDMVFQDRIYDDTCPYFPSTLAAVANLDYLSNKTVFVDEFLKAYHRSDALIISNSQSLACSLPVLCHVRPLGVLSLIRHIALFKFHLADIGPVQVSRKAQERRIIRNRYSMNKFISVSYKTATLIKTFLRPRPRASILSKANSVAITIPLDGFCSYGSKICKPAAGGWDREAISMFYDLAASTYYEKEGGQEPFHHFSPSSAAAKGPTSPFSCLVEEIFRIEDEEIQYTFIQVLWFERLVLWKIDTFARRIYLTRVGLPNLINVVLHLLLSLISILNPRRAVLIVLASLQAAVCAIWTLQKLRQARGTSLFFRSIFNYGDLISISLSFTMVALCFKGVPPRSFIAYSMPVLWINLVLMTRVFEPAGTLMILVTEMIRGIFPFLLLLTLFIIGFTFIPFLLLHGLEPDSPALNPFNSYSRTIGEVISFMANNFDSLDPFEDSLISIQILQSLFTVVVSILLLNVLIALLNLKVAAADIRSRQVWVRQMLLLLVETELGLLTDSERNDKRYFPRWFTYTVTEDEKRVWEKYMLSNKLGLGYTDDDDNRKKNEGPSINPTHGTPKEQQTAKLHFTGHIDGSLNEQQETKKPQMDLEPAFTTSSQPSSSKLVDDERVASSSKTYLCALPSCANEGTKICTGCRQVRYCCEEHQKIHWKKDHKQVCEWKVKET